MGRRCWTVVPGIVVALGLVACGGGDGDSADQEQPSATADQPADSPEGTTTPPGVSEPPPPADGQFGSYTVDGQSFPVTMLNRCPPFRDEPGNLDLQAIANRSILNVAINRGGEELEVSVQGAAIEEAFGSIAFGVSGDDVTADVTEERVSGSGTLSDAFESSTTVDVTFDVAIPNEINDC